MEGFVCTWFENCVAIGTAGTVYAGFTNCFTSDFAIIDSTYNAHWLYYRHQQHEVKIT